ncbi:DNA cytosine methyltransferase [Pseudomonas syringae]|uniref:DNA cytosine methyltransferase n=1 Tax=Pseudomonas syringae TaxID=317 RepID=UPI000EFF2A13|nr:DNA cytosine methyltransferase [Pseudomonas syringae]RMM20414.1 DNA-cytosine methyltransferase [Pseudomonas syringae pv. pisi]UZS61276.1 DNA cytosine methyltransferase [Pseudomonas syringae]
MSFKKRLKVVDLFAGPGGLGEGFSAFNHGKTFEILVSAEMDAAAHSTLQLRAFFRALKRDNPAALDDYYRFCSAHEAIEPWSPKSRVQWDKAVEEARLIQLGSASGNLELDKILEKKLSDNEPWILIGGPPCQAYSLVGRSRNRGKEEYRAEDDHRHFLYLEYLRIIQKKRPAIFVMENVKGILSSKVGGELIFPKILKDLSDPDVALGKEKVKGGTYKICSIVSSDVYESGDDPSKLKLNNFTIRAESYGVPQSRHRVILVGVSEEYADGIFECDLLKPEVSPSVKDVIGKLPKIRSVLTKLKDSEGLWRSEVITHLTELHSSLLEHNSHSLSFAEKIADAKKNFATESLGKGGLRFPRTGYTASTDSKIDKWLEDEKLSVWLNHESRGHMSSDLRRYVYSSIFAQEFKRSPKGHEEFSLKGLAPNHKNWETGKFKDRFKVQIEDLPSSTITSHISKDGHYFIHYDYTQCRSLTVREAARLQTFPDNYFFMGNRSEQYRQVGNAVPPLLALKIAEVVNKIINNSKNIKNKKRKQS